jgi:hypothetical protein
MNTTCTTNTTRLLAALGVAATAVMAPALLFAGAGTAHADDSCYDGSLAGSYYCSPASGAGLGSQTYEPIFQGPTPDQVLWNSLPQCSGGVLAALDGDCS